MPEVYLEYRGDYVELPVGETVIGRDVGCTLRFNDPAVSRRHARFVRREGEVFVEDLHSSNGTLVNDHAISGPVSLRDCDEIRVGARIITFHATVGDAVSESTLVLKSLEVVVERPVQRFMMGAVTAQFRVVSPPTSSARRQQRCPNCGELVSATDDECRNCHYHWGTARPNSVTALTPNPIARRRHDRKAVELSLVYVSSALEVEATTRDLSASGVFVCSGVLEPVGTTCQLTILIDGGPPLQVGGIVRRVVDHATAGGEPLGLGVEFKAVGPKQLAWIRAALEPRTEIVDDP